VITKWADTGLAPPANGVIVRAVELLDGLRIVKDGKKHGKGIKYYKNGNIQYEGDWIDNNINGKGISYYENGFIEYKGNLIDNKPNGKGIFYYESGYIKYKGYWINGITNGIIYDENQRILLRHPL